MTEQEAEHDKGMMGFYGHVLPVSPLPAFPPWGIWAGCDGCGELARQVGKTVCGQGTVMP